MTGYDSRRTLTVPEGAAGIDAAARLAAAMRAEAGDD